MATLQQIVQWASILTGESRVGGYYYVTEPVKRLEWSLTHVNGQLIALIGLQGTGKTSALNYLSKTFLKKVDEEIRKELKEKMGKGEISTIIEAGQFRTRRLREIGGNVIIKWAKGWFERLIYENYRVHPFINDFIKEAISEEFTIYHQSGRKHPFLKRIPDSEDCSEYGVSEALSKSESQAESIIGKSKVKKIREEAVYDYLERCDVIFIDLPDYAKSDRRLMARHLLEVQGLWEKIGKGKNMVIAIQKELFTGHFFFGKMGTIELKPLKQEELMHVFKTEFPDCDLMTDEALMLLGQLSRGVFRRFLRYLKLTCEKFAISNESPPINVNHVNEAVTIEELMKDMELELYDLFKDANQRRQAVELLHHLRNIGSMNQKEIAEFLNVSLATAGRFVSKLYRYVKRERGKGREWLISLKV